MRISTTALLQFVLRLTSVVFKILALVYVGNVLGSNGVGTYSLAITVTVWVWVLADPGIGSALVKRVSEGDDRAEFFSAALIVISLIVTVLTGLLFLFRRPINAYVGINATPFIVALVVLHGLSVVVRGAISGHNRVATSSLVRFVERTLRPALQVGAVFVGMGVSGMLFGYVGSLLISGILGVAVLPTWLRRPSREHFEQLFSFAKFSVLKMIRPRAARWTDTAVLGFLVSTSLVGVYEISWSIALVLILATDSLISSLFPKLSELANEDKIKRVTAMTESGLTFTGVIVIPGFVGTLLLGNNLLELFGAEFTAGIAVLPILITWSLIVSYGRVLRSTMDALDHPELTFRANLVYITANIVGNITLVYLFGWVGAAVATAGAAILSLIVTARYAASLMDFEFPFLEVLKQVIASGCMALVVYPVHMVTRQFPRPAVLVPIAVGAVVYFITLLILSSRIRDRVFTMLSR